MKSANILVVEDDDVDIMLLKKALGTSKRIDPARVHVVSDGERAMAFLRREHPFEHAPTPVLILLDLNMPVKDGREVLADLKSDPELRRIPVVVLTTSKSKTDIKQAYDLAANSYVIKHENFSDFKHAVEAIEEFWLETAVLPRTG